MTEVITPAAGTVEGHGRLAMALSEHVGRLAGTTVLADDHWSTPDPDRLARARADGERVLPVRTAPGRVLIGPLAGPGLPGCPGCAERRRRRARREREGWEAVEREHGAELAGTVEPRLTAAAIDAVVALVEQEANGPGGAVITVDLADLSARRHRFLPDPLCPDCGRLPDDGPARWDPPALPKPDPDRYRTSDIRARAGALRDAYVDEETGLIRELKRGVQGGLVVAGAILPLRTGTGTATEPGVGRSRSYLSSELTAILEALERWGGTEPGGRRTVVTGSRAELGDAALDVRRLGLHDPARYARPDFGYRPFTDDAVARWVWAYALGAGRPVLVPETAAYYHLPGSRTGIAQPFHYENSNGCALGGSLTEAALHGLLEVLERDAFLLAWHTRRPAAELDLAGAADVTIPLQAASIEDSTGYRVRAFDITPEHGLPCVWVLAEAGPERADPSTYPRLVCAAGAHPDPVQATLNALNEVGPLLADLVARYPALHERAAAMVADPEQVRTMPDHSVLYGHPEAAARLGFLTDQRPSRDVTAVGSLRLRHLDLRDDLAAAVAAVRAGGMEVIVVDQTTPEHRAGGLACAKVLVPGAASMTFGHGFARLHGLPRLRRLPYELGWADAPLTASELNLHPHPFP